MAIDLPPGAAERWRAVGDRTDEGRLAVAAVAAETTVYEHVPTAAALAAVGDATAIPARSLFTVELTFDPSPPAIGIDPADALAAAAPKANARVRDVLADEGIAVETRRYDERVKRADETVGHLSVYGAAYPVEAADDGSSADEAASSPDGAIDAEVHVAVWPTDEAYAIVGGVVPLEAPDGVDLDVDPDRDRTRLLAVVRSVDLGDEP